MTLSDIKKLSVAERIVLVEKIWDSIPSVSLTGEIPTDHKREIDRRIGKIETDTATFVPWADITKELSGRRK